METISRRQFVRLLGLIGTAAAGARASLGSAPTAHAADHITDTYRAFADTVFPPTPTLPHALSGTDVNVDRFMMEAFDSYLSTVPGTTATMPLKEVVVGILDAHAAQVTPGKTFVDQTFDERIRTLAAMDDSPSGDVRFIAFALPGMAALGFYTEWPTYGSRFTGEHHDIDPSAVPVWGEIGFPGPQDGYPKLLVDYDPGSPIDPTSVTIP